MAFTIPSMWNRINNFRDDHETGVYVYEETTHENNIKFYV